MSRQQLAAAMVNHGANLFQVGRVAEALELGRQLGVAPPEGAR